MGKEVKKRQTNRGKKAPNPARHSGKCSVCNSSEKSMIEAAYHDFRSVAQIAEEYGLTDDAIYRHVSFFSLDLKRSENTQKLLLDVAARGFADGKLIPPKVALGAIQELHKITGKHKEPAKNPEAAAREAYERLRQDFIDIPDETIRQRVAERYGVQESVLIH